MNSAPKQTVIVPLCKDINIKNIMEQLFTANEQKLEMKNGQAILEAEKFKQRISFIPCFERNMLYILDCLKVADKIIFVLSAEEEVDEFGEMIMSCIKGQGVPDVILMVQHLEDQVLKKQPEIKKSLLYYMSHHFSQEPKLFSAGSTTDCLNCIRHITAQVPKGIVWRDRHPYLTAENVEFVPNNHGTGTLKVTGFVRGNSLSANRLIHIPDFGDFQIERILDARIVHKNEMTVDEDVLEFADPELRDSLQDQNEVDPMDAEQTWPTEEEMAEGDGIL
jgi:pre-rRNA-processing protein TSR1